jgi:hypothetical protein
MRERESARKFKGSGSGSERVEFGEKKRWVVRD